MFVRRCVRPFLPASSSAAFPPFSIPAPNSSTPSFLFPFPLPFLSATSAPNPSSNSESPPRSPLDLGTQDISAPPPGVRVTRVSSPFPLELRFEAELELRRSPNAVLRSAPRERPEAALVCVARAGTRRGPLDWAGPPFCDLNVEAEDEAALDFCGAVRARGSYCSRSGGDVC